MAAGIWHNWTTGLTSKRSLIALDPASNTATTDNTGLILGIVGTAIGLIAFVLAFSPGRRSSASSGGTRSSKASYSGLRSAARDPTRTARDLSL
jgi:hypothetical protein